MEPYSSSSRLGDDSRPPMSLLDLCKNLQRARRSYLLDDRFASAVAFIDGFDLGQDRLPLAGFPEFLLTKFYGGIRSPYHWSYLILASEDHPLLGNVSLAGISPELDDALTRKMLDLLVEFATFQ